MQGTMVPCNSSTSNNHSQNSLQRASLKVCNKMTEQQSGGGHAWQSSLGLKGKVRLGLCMHISMCRNPRNKTCSQDFSGTCGILRLLWLAHPYCLQGFGRRDSKDPSGRPHWLVLPCKSTYFYCIHKTKALLSVIYIQQRPAHIKR